MCFIDIMLTLYPYIWMTLYPKPGMLLTRDTAPSLDTALFIAGNWNQNVTAYNAKTGETVWAVDLGGSIESHPAYYDGVVYMSTEAPSSTLWALDVKTGETVWKYV